MVRIMLFITLTLLVQTGWWWLFVPIGIGYAFRYTAYELIALGFMVDWYFGGVSVVPLYGLLSLMLVIVMEWLKPALMVYTEPV